MKYLIALALTATLYISIKQTYKLAQIQDEVEAPLDYFKGGEKS